MTRHLITAIALAVPGILCAPLPVQAAPRAKANAQAPAKQQAIPVSSVQNDYRLMYPRKGRPLTVINYAEDVVPPEAVGGEDKLGIVSVSPDVSVRAVWTSQSELTVVLTGDLDPEAVYSIKGRAGVKNAQGREVFPFAALPFAEHLTDYFGSSERFICCPDNHADTAAKFLGRAVLRSTDKTGKVTDRPANLRPATVGDAVAHWDDYLENGDYKEDIEAFKALPQDEVLSGCWYFEKPVPAAHERLELVLPGYGRLNSETGQRRDSVIRTAVLPGLDIILESRHTGLGRYDILVELEQPVPAEELERAVREGVWEIRLEDDSKAAPVATMQMENGVLKATVNGKPVAMSYDAEATAKSLKNVPTASGEKPGCTTAVLHLDTAGQCFRLTSKLSMTSVHGQVVKAATDSRFVSPPPPTINTDVLTSGKLSKGSRTIHCLVQSLEKATAHIYRIDAHGNAPAKVLAAFRELYTPAKVRELGEWTDEADAAKEHPTTFPVQLLPNVAESAEVDIPCDSEPHDIKLGELFPNAPESSMFFIEVGGTLVPDLGKPGARYANQGIVQVTDLGLMWKESRDKIFCYAYRLSDAKALERATLLLQDKNGETIDTLDVKDGIAEGSLLKGTCFLQLVCGDDCYTVAMDAPKSRNTETHLTGDFWTSEAEQAIPRTETFLFSDRSLYRPGETAHIKGYVRTFTGDNVSIPELTSITAKVEGDNTPIKVDVEPDGSFAVDVQPATVSSDLSVEFTMVHAGDGNGTSPDMAAVKALGADPEDVQYILNGSRHASISLNVQEFHRDEFELKQGVTIDPAAQWLEVSADATAFSGSPVANGSVEWELRQYCAALSPDAFPSFVFNAYAGMEERSNPDTETAGAVGKLDAEGHGTHRFDLAAVSGRQRIAVSCTVTNGNARSVRFAESRIVDSSDIYGGIRIGSCIVEKGGSAALSLVAVDAEGNALSSAPVNARLKVERQSFRSYRFGLGSTSAARNVPRIQTVTEQDVQLTGVPSELSIPVDQPGKHLVTLEGTDAKGRPFKATQIFYVVGENEMEEDIPWQFRDGLYLGLVRDKKLYKPGETAHVLVQSPVDAEALVTIERDGVVRHFTQHISAAHPIVDIPLTEADAPGVNAAIFLVQDASARKDGSALPIVKAAETILRVDPVGKHLSVELDKPASPQQPGAAARLSGVVKDAQGNPLANAGVTLYAEDEGTLQIRGYKLPDPIRGLYGSVPCPALRTFSSLFQICGETFKTSMLGNKGVFIGGGDDEEEEMEMSAVRENFNPCAVWIANVKTDAQGRFSADYTNPDTLTRYRVMAVAAAGADKFGAGQTSYEVNKAVMLEPAAPAAAAQGDELFIPVTVSMNPDQLPEEYRTRAVTWNISLNAENAENAETQPGPISVTLTGNKPVTALVPVRMPQVGETTLTWTATAADEALRGKTDSVRDRFTVVPPTPYLREAVYEAVEAGENRKPADLVTLDFRSDSRVSLDFSANPLIGATQGMDMLVHYPYGCSEQLASGMLPWICQDELAACIGMQYPQENTRAAVIAKSVKTLSERFTSGRGFSYWDGGEVTPFSPHVALSLLLAQEKGISLPYNISTANLCKMLVNATADCADPSAAVYAAYVLARAGKLTPELLAQAEKRLPKNADARMAWGLALAARVSGSPRADELCKAAAKASEKQEWSYLPAVRTLRMLEQIAREPKAERTAQAVREYVAYDAQHFNSTYGNAWLVIVLHEFISRSDVQNVHAVVNGNELALQKMWHQDTTVGAQDTYACSEGTAYACGIAEGYQNKDQEPRMVDEGFKVTRRYERYMGNNTWQPTAVFTVGDVVRITLECTPTRDTGRYTVLEDRLPAAFEAVNPELLSQDVPAELRSNPSCGWSFTNWVDNKVYGKDRVAFFSSHGGTLKCSYIARVVKFGKVTAPAAKAEMMYTPQNYGLSIPHVITVNPPEIEK